MKFLFIAGLFLIALVNIGGCERAQKEYDDYISYANGLGGAAEGFLRGYVNGATGNLADPTQSMADRENELAIAKKSSFNWAYGTTALAVIVALANRKKKGQS